MKFKVVKYLLVILMLSFPYLLVGQEKIDLLILNNEYDKALEMVDNELTRNEAQPLVHLKKGVILQKKFDITGAVKSLERVWQLDSLHPGIFNEAGEAHSALGNYQLALPFFKTLFDADTTNVVNALKLVRSYLASAITVNLTKF